MKKAVWGSLGFVAAGLTMLAIAGPAIAQPVPGSWTGFNVGINGGGSFGGTGAGQTGQPTNNPGSTANFHLDSGLNGAMGGAQLGYLWQFGGMPWALGIETDLDGADITGKRTLSGSGVAQRNGGNANPGNFVSVQEDIHLFGTTRLRGGYVWDSLFLYATGGLAYAHLDDKGHVHYATPVDYNVSNSTFLAGWAAGAGVEYRLTGMWSMMGPGVWSVKAEYLYYDLGNHNLTSNSGGAGNAFTSRFKFEPHGSVVRIGLNYNFNWF